MASTNEFCHKNSSFSLMHQPEKQFLWISHLLWRMDFPCQIWSFPQLNKYLVQWNYYQFSWWSWFTCISLPVISPSDTLGLLFKNYFTPREYQDGSNALQLMRFRKPPGYHQQEEPGEPHMALEQVLQFNLYRKQLHQQLD